MKVSQLLPSIRFEVEKPFQEKLRRAKELVHIFGGLAGGKACVSCSLGKDSMAVLWLARQEKKDIPVIFNNTGVQYKETYEFKDRIVKEWNLNLIETKPERSFWQILEQLHSKGQDLDDGKKHSNQCCYALKDKPFRKVVKEFAFTLCFTGLTAIESRHRMFTACHRGQEYYSKKDGLTKVHPIMFWTPKEVWEFTSRVQIPVNPAYKKYGIERLGCVPCTSHLHWREQLSKTSPKMLKLILKRYFDQPQLEDFSLGVQGRDKGDDEAVPV